MVEKIGNTLLIKNSYYILQYYDTCFIGKLIGTDYKWSVKREQVKVGKEERTVFVADKKQDSCPVIIFEAYEQKKAEQRGIVSEIFEHSKPTKFYFTRPMLFDTNLRLYSVRDWLEEKIQAMNIFKLSDTMIKVNVDIAMNMLKRENFSKFVNRELKADLDKLATDIINQKKSLIEGIRDQQEKEMPF